MRGRDLKAEATRAGVPLYKLAAEVGIHTTRLSRLLNGREVVTDALADRILSGIVRMSAAQ